MIKLSRSRAILCLIILFASAGWSRIHLNSLEKNKVVSQIDIRTLPKQIGEWRGEEGQGLDIRSQEILRITDYVRRAYTAPDGRSVFLYLGYWKEQTGEYQAAKHSPQLCLPSNGWSTLRKPAVSVDVGAGVPPVSAKQLIGEIRTQASLFYYWFFTGHRSYPEEWRALLNISLERFFYGRSDGGIVEISAVLRPGKSKEESEKDARETIESFIRALDPELKKILAIDSAPSVDTK